MNGLDILFSLIIGLALLRGLFRGVVREVSSLAALAAGFVLAGRYAQDIAGSVQKLVSNAQLASGLSYVGVFLATFIAVVFLGALVRKTLHAVFLGWADRIGGGFFGLAKGLVISCLLLFVLTLFISPGSALVSESRLSPYLNHLTQKMVVLIPADLKETFARKSRELQKIWRQSRMTYDGVNNDRRKLACNLAKRHRGPVGPPGLPLG